MIVEIRNMFSSRTSAFLELSDAFMKTRHAAVIFQLQYLYCLFTEDNSIDLFHKIIKILLLVLFCVVCVGALKKLIVPPSKA